VVLFLAAGAVSALETSSPDVPKGLTADDWQGIREAHQAWQVAMMPPGQQAYLKASNTRQGNGFGVSVAVSGDTAVVGAQNENGAGAAYVFIRSGTTWTQPAYLKASNAQPFDDFGSSVAVSGDTVVVGAPVATPLDDPLNESRGSPGSAYVFTRSGTSWTQQAYLKASNTGNNDEFGGSVAVSGDTVVVGAPLENSSTTGVNSTPNESAPSAGAAYVFTGFSASDSTVVGNISTRASVFTGDNVLIAGFILTGSAPEPMLVRAIGPTLTGFGVAGALVDPVLELYDGKGALIATNSSASP
jgi:hypothetical protein